MIKELEIVRGFAAFYVFQGHLLQMLGLNKNRFVDLVFCSFGFETYFVLLVSNHFYRCTCTYTHTHTHTYTYAYAYTCTYTCIRVRLHVYICTYIDARIHIHVHMHVK